MPEEETHSRHAAARAHLLGEEDHGSSELTLHLQVRLNAAFHLHRADGRQMYMKLYALDINRINGCVSGEVASFVPYFTKPMLENACPLRKSKIVETFFAYFLFW